MNLLFGPWMNQFDRTTAVRARQACGGAEQAADQRAFVVHGAALRAEVHTVELVEGRFLLGGVLRGRRDISSDEVVTGPQQS